MKKQLELHNIDCMDYISKCKDNQFDLAIVDPPYGINAPNMSLGANKSKNKTNTSTSVALRLKKARFSKGSGKLKDRILNKDSLNWDVAPPQEYFEQLFRISKNQIIFGGNYFNLPPTRGIICWDKNQPWKNFSQWEMIWTSFDRPASMFRYSNRGGNNKIKKIHPTQKPVQLYKYLLLNYANEGDSIIDTHLGSASIAIACLELNYSLTGLEKDAIYFKDSLNRINQYEQQLRLF